MSPSGAAYYDATTNSWKNAYVQIQNANPNLKWEATQQFNIGVDFSLFNRLTGTIEVYNKNTKDLLWTYPVPQPPYLVGTMLANVGNLKNTGVELTLHTNIIRSKDWTFDANMSFAYNHQKITKLSNDLYKAVGLQAGSLHDLRGMSNMYSQVIKEGYAAGAFWGPVCEGVDENGKYILKKGREWQGC